MYLVPLILISIFTFIILEIIWYLLSTKVDKKKESKNKIKIKLKKYKKFINRYKRLPQIDSKSLREQELAIWMKSIKEELFKLNQSQNGSRNKKLVKEIQKMFDEVFSNS